MIFTIGVVLVIVAMIYGENYGIRSWREDAFAEACAKWVSYIGMVMTLGSICVFAWRHLP